MAEGNPDGASELFQSAILIELQHGVRRPQMRYLSYYGLSRAQARGATPDTIQACETASRRDFFKVMGLSAAAAMTACQRAPVQKVIPFISRPDEVTPGLALWYASTCGECGAGCGVGSRRPSGLRRRR